MIDEVWRGSLRAWLVVLGAVASASGTVACCDVALAGFQPATSANASAAPDSAVRLKAEQQIKARYKSDYAKATNRDGKLALGTRLYSDAAEFMGDAAERFVLYDQAAKILAEVGETAQAWSVIDDMATAYDVDAIALKAAAAKAALKLVKNEADALALTQMHLTLLDEAVALGRYDAGAQLGPQLIQVARKADSAPLNDQIQERAKRARDLAAAYKEARPSKEKLEQSPDDSRACRVWGRFLCFWNDDWTGGLPLLEKGDDASFATVAKKDAANSTDADALVQLADDWWAISEKEKGVPQALIQERAFEIYRNALPGVSETQRRAVEQRALRIFGKTQFHETTEKVRGVSLGGVDVNIGPAFTLELWVQTAAREGFLITKRHEEHDGTLALVLAGGRPVVWGNGSFYTVAGEAKQTINDNRWHHLAAVKNGLEVDLYVDGRPAAHITTRAEFESKSPWMLGFFGVGNIGQLNATFCRIRMSNVARYRFQFTPDRRYGSDKYTVFAP